MGTKFCVSGHGRVVEAIFSAQRAGLLELDEASVLVDRPDLFRPTAEAYGIAVDIVDRSGFPNRDDFRDALGKHLIDSTADSLFLTFDWLLPRGVVRRFEGRIVNLHMALLPLFRGKGAIEQAAASGMTIAGVTYHIVDDGMDTGPIIAQAIHPIGGMTPKALGLALFRRAVPLGIQVMRWIETARLLNPPHPHAVTGATLSDGPFFPDIDEDIMDFAAHYLRAKFNVD